MFLLHEMSAIYLRECAKEEIYKGFCQELLSRELGISCLPACPGFCLWIPAAHLLLPSRHMAPITCQAQYLVMRKNVV